jgi:pimeloyl-ACP methyl ester carboxylesterase
MKKKVLPYCLFLMGLATCVPASGEGDNNQISDVGMFFVGGSVKEGAANHTEQALVHFFVSNAAPEVPVILYPGLGLSSIIYITTPDGREGWAQQLAKSGHAAYVYDPVNTGPSGIPTDKAVNLTTWGIDEVWPRFGLGSERDKPYDDTRFPTEYADQFYASWPSRISSGGPGRPRGEEARPGQPPARVMQGSAADEAALIQLLDKTGPAVLIPHSMGGTTVFRLAKSRPDLVEGIVVVEPLGCPTSPEDIEPWKDKPFLAVYGDYIESRNQTGRLAACRETVRLLNAADGNGTMLELTKEGVFGNTHLLMLDNNSAEIAALIINWINKNVD